MILEKLEKLPLSDMHGFVYMGIHVSLSDSISVNVLYASQLFFNFFLEDSDDLSPLS